MLNNYQALKYFQVYAQEEHFRRTADKLFISQTTLSKSMQDLEEEIGVPLFQRKGRTTQLTRYGRILRDTVIRGYNEIDGAIRMIQNMNNSEVGEIKMVTSFIFPEEIAYAIGAYVIGHPAVTLEIDLGTARHAVHSLEKNEIDLGIASFCYNSKDPFFEAISMEAIYHDEIVIGVPAAHPFATKESLTIEEISEESFIGHPAYSVTETEVERALTNAGVEWRPRIIMRTVNVEAFVKAGAGLAFCSRIAANRQSGLIPVPLKSPQPFRMFYLIWRKDEIMSAGAKALKHHLLFEMQHIKES
ncbi:MAG: LysR family transcriptional regulator [Lachnospiraceae bacterium]|nr:LysR family transcriptional regulator [Lachnospiraceae bacterium]